MPKITVIEMDQWTSTGNVTQQDFDKINLHTVEGGDSEAAKAIFGGSFTRKEVGEAEMPRLGYVWYIKGDDGKPKLFKSNYDTSG